MIQVRESNDKLTIPNPIDPKIEKKLKIKSFLVLLIITILVGSLNLVFFLLPLISGNLGAGALGFIAIGGIVTPISIIISLGLFFLAVRLFRLARLHFAFLALPIIVSISTANIVSIVFFITPIVVSISYSGLNPEISLIQEEIIQSDENSPNITLAKYIYKINAYNKTDKTFNSVSVSINLDYNQTSALEAYTSLGRDYKRVMIKPGDNIIEGRIILAGSNSNNYNFLDKDKLNLYFEYSPGTSQKKSVSLAVSPDIDSKLKTFVDQAKVNQAKTDLFEKQLESLTLPTSNPQVITSINPPSDWKKYVGNTLSFYYPAHWTVEVLHEPARKSYDQTITFPAYSTALFNLDGNQILFVRNITDSSALEEVKQIQRRSNGIYNLTAIQIGDRVGTKLSVPKANPNNQDTIFIQAGDNTYEFTGKIGLNFYEILGTVNF